MEIKSIFSKNLIVELKKRVENCIESHRWIILEKSEDGVLHLKKLHENFVLHDLKKGDNVDIEIAVPTGIFIFESEVKKLKDENSIEIMLPEKVKKIIKRDSKRIETKMGAYIDNRKAMVLDISESGVYCISKEEFKIGDCVTVTIVNGEESIELKSAIIRKEKILNGRSLKNYGYGLKFDNNDALKEEIAQLIKEATLIAAGIKH